MNGRRHASFAGGVHRTRGRPRSRRSSRGRRCRQVIQLRLARSATSRNFFDAVSPLTHDSLARANCARAWERTNEWRRASRMPSANPIRRWWLFILGMVSPWTPIGCWTLRDQSRPAASPAAAGPSPSNTPPPDAHLYRAPRTGLRKPARGGRIQQARRGRPTDRVHAGADPDRVVEAGGQLRYPRRRRPIRLRPQRRDERADHHYH